MKFEASPSNRRNIPDELNLKKKNITYGRIEVLKYPISRILENLSEQIKSGKFNVIIGDDASGRIPTLIIRKTLELIYRKINKKVPKTLFLAGAGQPGFATPEGYEKKRKLVDEYIGAQKFNNSDHVLIVTDTINTGNSLMPLTEALEAKSVSYDIATIATAGSVSQSALIRKLGVAPVVGVDVAPAIYGMHMYGGVVKDSEELHARRLHHDSKDMEIIALARKDVDLLADELADEFIAKEFPGPNK